MDRVSVLNEKGLDRYAYRKIQLADVLVANYVFLIGLGLSLLSFVVELVMDTLTKTELTLADANAG